MSAPDVKPKPAATTDPGNDTKVENMVTDIKEEPIHVKNTVV